MAAPMNVCETDRGYQVEVAMPGVKPEDIDVAVHQNTLSIKGSYKQQQNQQDQNQQDQNQQGQAQHHKVRTVRISRTGSCRNSVLVRLNARSHSPSRRVWHREIEPQVGLVWPRKANGVADTQQHGEGVTEDTAPVKLNCQVVVLLLHTGKEGQRARRDDLPAGNTWIAGKLLEVFERDSTARMQGPAAAR